MLLVSGKAEIMGMHADIRYLICNQLVTQLKPQKSTALLAQSRLSSSAANFH